MSSGWHCLGEALENLKKTHVFCVHGSGQPFAFLHVLEINFSCTPLAPSFFHQTINSPCPLSVLHPSHVPLFGSSCHIFYSHFSFPCMFWNLTIVVVGKVDKAGLKLKHLDVQFPKSSCKPAYIEDIHIRFTPSVRIWRNAAHFKKPKWHYETFSYVSMIKLYFD